MPDLVLCRPGFARRAEAHWGGAPPLGLAYLAAACREGGLSVAVVDGKAEGHLTTARTAARIVEHNPGLLGLSMMTPEYNQAAAIAELVKSELPDVMTIVGGAHVNALPRESLHGCEYFDASMAGEAEERLPSVARSMLGGKTPSDFGGTFHRDLSGGVTPESVAETHAPDVDNITRPAWDLFPRSQVYPVLTERGCPYSCVFCCHNLDHRVRRRSVDSVISEIAWLKSEFAPDWIYLEDETFGLSQERTVLLLEGLLRLNRDRHLKFKAQTRVDCLDQGTLKLMKEAGFEYLEIGVETGDPEILEKSGKGIRLEQVGPAVKLAKSVGIKTWLKFIIGLPGETGESVRRTIDLAASLNPERLSVATIVAYPGSKLYEWARRGTNGYRLASHNWDAYDKYLGDSVELKTISSGMMKRLQIQTYFEVYARNGRWKELASFLWQNRSFVWPAARAMCSGIRMRGTR